MATGERKWWVTVTSSGTSTPAYAEGMLYVATLYPFGEADQRGVLPDFDVVLTQHDKDGDGTLAREEIPRICWCSAVQKRPTFRARPCRCAGSSIASIRTRTGDSIGLNGTRLSLWFGS